MGLIRRSIAWLYRFVCCIEQLGFINAIKIFLIGRILNLEIAIKLPNAQTFYCNGRLDGVTSHFYNWAYYIQTNDGPAIQTIIDGGANIGVETARFHFHYPDAHIIAVEAAKRNFSYLEKNFKENEKVDCVLGGLWPIKTNLNVHSPAASMESFVVEETEKENLESIKAFPIQELMDRKNWKQIDILKLDIEGAEYELFTKNYKSWIDKVNVLIFEVPDVDRAGATQVIFKALADLNFNTFHCGENLVLIKNHLPWTLKKVIGFEKG